ncbi:calpain-A-like [Diorhabda carinulata]|uniref:calpain-A-like n=1 Tax=Diorhabda carinulata TaxID=1163345 RepID=UPI0025A2F2F5|nr:calpain-A-like [Diorhabda carinulata]
MKVHKMSKPTEDGQLISGDCRYICTGFNPRKIYLLGEKYSGLKSRGSLQKFEDIRSYCLKKKILFNDQQFAPDNVQLGEKWESVKENIKWLRPQEMVSNPYFLDAGENRFDVNQGNLGDCWFLAALVNILENRKLFQLIVPENQSYSEDYAGVFHFRFWQYGRWIDVVIDDKLPTIDGKLIFTKTKYANVFWTPLLEKAYAKLYGSYANIEGGYISDALEDLTGGLNEVYPHLLEFSKNQDVFKMMLVSFLRKSFMGCAITDSTVAEEENEYGLYSRHAYSITNVVEVLSKNGKPYKLLRLRNPWGTGEWKGNWSDNSNTWEDLPENTKQKLLVKANDGEFWMQYEQFIEMFNLLEFCHPNPDSMAYNKDELHQWKTFIIDGAWEAKISNGGVPTSTNFWLNSQFILNVNGQKDETHRVLVSVTQKNRRIYKLPELPIGVAVYALKAACMGPLPQNYFSSIKPIYVKKAEPSRQIVCHLDLSNGSYCIIPFTEDTKSSCEYLLRIYSTVDFVIDENEVDVRLIDPSAPLGGLYSSPDAVDSTSADVGISEVFKNLANEKMEIGWKELKSVLSLLLKQENLELSKELCRSMIALADTDCSGKLNFSEFYQLWEQIGILRGIFRNYDSDTSKGISPSEMRQALRAANFQLSNKVLRVIMLRYGNENTELEMDDFLHCCFKLRIMIDIYKSKKNRSETLENWLVETLYA